MGMTLDEKLAMETLEVSTALIHDLVKVKLRVKYSVLNSDLSRPRAFAEYRTVYVANAFDLAQAMKVVEQGFRQHDIGPGDNLLADLDELEELEFHSVIEWKEMTPVAVGDFPWGTEVLLAPYKPREA